MNFNDLLNGEYATVHVQSINGLLRARACVCVSSSNGDWTSLTCGSGLMKISQVVAVVDEIIMIKVMMKV